MEYGISDRSIDFAIQIVELYKCLLKQKEYILSKQILRSGTSIGANVSESVYAQSRADFTSKMSIALKEASETRYWLIVLNKTGYIDGENFQKYFDEITRIIKILTAIVKKSKA